MFFSFDLRKIVGALFVLLGAMLAAYGVQSPSLPPQAPIDINVNLAWGTIMVVFGLILFLLPRRNNITS